MSMCPVIIQIERPPRHSLLHTHDPHFRSGASLEDYLPFLNIPHMILDNASRLQSQAHTGSTIKEESNKFQVNLDIHHFTPEEISVKTADGYLVVEAKHEEKADEHGYISRSFTRRYALPENVDLDNMGSKLSSDGVLTITAPLKTPQTSPNERLVPIIQTGPVKKQLKDSHE